MQEQDIFPQDGSDFVRTTLDILHGPERFLTPLQVIDAYRYAYEFAKNTGQYSDLDAILFAIAYGKYMTRKHTDSNLQISQTAQRYLDGQFSEDDPGSFLSRLEVNYQDLGVIPGPLHSLRLVDSYFIAVFRTNNEIAPERLVLQLEMLGFPAKRNPQHAELYSESTIIAGNAFEGGLKQVETGHYLHSHADSV